MVFPRDDDYQHEDLEEISMNYGKSYPRVHPRSSFIGHGTGVLSVVHLHIIYIICQKGDI